MGLDLEVGIVADLSRHDPEGLEYYRDQFARVNRLLAAHGLPPHREPEDLPEERVFSCAMAHYSGLHHLRRVAAHLALGRGVPAPIARAASADPLLRRYYLATCGGVRGLLGSVVLRRRPATLDFRHLVVHSDAEGFYLPQPFDGVLFAPAGLGVAGDVVGSVPRLLDECRRIAAALALPLELDHESDELIEAASARDPSQDGWRRHGLESFSCLRLIRACEASLVTGAALVFC